MEPSLSVFGLHDHVQMSFLYLSQVPDRALSACYMRQGCRISMKESMRSDTEGIEMKWAPLLTMVFSPYMV
jgi:hypothetical protein